MEGKLLLGWLWRRRTQNIADKVKNKDDVMQRYITTKASNRAAVHGTKRPVTETINKEEAENEINQGKEEKEKKKKEVEKIVDSNLKNHYDHLDKS